MAKRRSSKKGGNSFSYNPDDAPVWDVKYYGIILLATMSVASIVLGLLADAGEI